MFQANNEYFSLFLRALDFAAHKHRFQKRKGYNPPPYINHPIQVAKLLWDVGRVRDPELLAAALLHDTIEDTGTGAHEIEEMFGERVARIVLEVSDDKHLPSHKRKELQVVMAPKKSPEAKQLKIADKICNITDMASAPPAHWSIQRRLEYLKWSARVVNGMRGICLPLEELFDQRLVEGYKNLRENS